MSGNSKSTAGRTQPQGKLRKRPRISVESLESRFCLSSAITAACPPIVMPPASVSGSSTITTATTNTTSAVPQQQEFHFEYHEFRPGAHMLPGHGTYSLMSIDYSTGGTSLSTADGAPVVAPAGEGAGGWGKGMIRIDNSSHDETRADHDAIGGGFFNRLVNGGMPMFNWHVPHDAYVIIRTGVQLPPGTITMPQTPTTPVTPPSDGSSGGVVIEPPTQPTYDQTGGQASSGSGETGGVGGSVHIGPRLSHGTGSGSIATTVLGKTGSASASELANSLQPVANSNAFASSSTSGRQGLAQVIDATSAAASGLRTASLHLSPTASENFSLGSLASTLDGAFFNSVLPKVHFAVPSAADVAANMEAAAAQAVARVVVTSQPAFEFEHMGSPFALVADSLGAFIEDSASIPTGVARAHHSQGPWMLTFAVIAADVVVLTYMHRRRIQAARQRFATQTI